VKRWLFSPCSRFVTFHQVFFTPGSWTFNISDTLIGLFPERFWYDAAMTISGMSLIGGLGTASIGWYLELNNKPDQIIRSAYHKVQGSDSF
jgi:uncharacterized membrane protein